LVHQGFVTEKLCSGHLPQKFLGILAQKLGVDPKTVLYGRNGMDVLHPHAMFGGELEIGLTLMAT